MKNKTSLFLTLLLALMLMTFVQAQDDNPNGQSDEIITNNSEKLKIYSPGYFDKPKTVFDGVSNEQYVSYLKLDGDQSVNLPIAYSGALYSQINFSLTFWFKIDDDVLSNKMMYLFQLDEDLSCHLTRSDELICESSKQCEKIIMSTSKLYSNQWYHFTFSTSSSGAAYVAISDNYKLIELVEVQDFTLMQTDRSWDITLGNCGEHYGFKGGIREFLVTNNFLPIRDIKDVKNLVQEFDKSILAYVRFSNYGDMFGIDQFRDVNVDFNGSDRDSMLQVDFIPNDVCSKILELTQFVKVTPKNTPREFKLSQDLQQQSYEYTMSLTLMFDDHTCYESNPNKAQKNCNIVYVDDVFMLYFEKPNRARISFFAKKLYYESTSPSFFVPQDQWVTIQMTMSRFGGYSVKLLDQNGDIFRQFSRMRNMREMRPDSKIKLFDSFSGYIDNFTFCTKRFELPVDPLSLSKDDCPINIQLTNEGLGGTSIVNSGSDDHLQLVSNPQYDWINYKRPKFGGQEETFDDQNDENLFDGIACNDKHMYMKLQEQGQFEFNTPEMPGYVDSATIEFWFKIVDGTQDAYQYLTTMRAPEREFDGFEIFLSENQELVCAPFGTKSVLDPLLVFENFKEDKTDDHGWFHVSCSYKYQGMVRSTLSNSLFEEVQELSLAGNIKYFPRDSMTIRFGDPGVKDKYGAQMFVKEVRYWTEQLDTKDIFLWRRNQMDPVMQAPSSLQHYFRLAAGDYDLLDLGQYVEKSDNVTVISDPKLSGSIDIQEEFSTINEYYVDTETGLRAIRKVPLYHTVCPMYTYYMEGYCYSEPINKLTLSIIPEYNTLDNQLQHIFTIENSSVLSKSVFENLYLKWEVNDPVLAIGFVNKTTDTEVRIDPSLLRNNGQYHIKVTATNLRETFKQSSEIYFVPNQCEWLQEKNGAATGGIVEEMLTQGTSDLVFQLEIKQNPRVSCAQTFYDQFKDLRFDDFILQETTEYINERPNLSWNFTNDAKTQINVTIPAGEQYKLPLAKIIKIKMSAIWTSSKYDQALQNEDYIMHNLEFSVYFAPIANELVSDLTINRPYAIRDNTVRFDATGSYVTNLPDYLSRIDLAYSWLCPDDFIELCETQTGDTLTISFASFVNLGLPQFETYYTFTVVVNWIKADGTIESGSSSQDIIWWNVSYPIFDVTFDEPVLLSNDLTRFSMVPENFDDADLSYFNIDWSIQPKLPDPSVVEILFSGKMLQIQSWGFETNTEYIVTCSMLYKTLPEVKTERNVIFFTKSIPIGGIVTINPETGELGDRLTVEVQRWVSDYPPVVFNLYKTEDSDGEVIGDKINSSPVQQGLGYSFFVDNKNPVYVEITDSSNEIVKQMLYPVITDKLPDPTPVPDPDDNSEDDSDSTTNDDTIDEPADDTIDEPADDTIDEPADDTTDPNPPEN